MPAFHLLFAIALASPEAHAESLRRQGATALQVHRVQLDSDAVLEAVIQYELADTGVHAVVLDQRGSEWREAGRFNSWWNLTQADADRFLEFRSTVDLSVKDILIRTRSGGTEDSRTTLEIARLRDGVMSTVLSIKEHETAMEHPSGEVYTSVAEIASGSGVVMVKTTRNPGAHRSCQRYAWNASRFQFQEMDGCP